MSLNNIIDVYERKLIKSTQELVSISGIKGEPKEDAPFGEKINKVFGACL